MAGVSVVETNQSSSLPTRPRRVRSRRWKIGVGVAAFFVALFIAVPWFLSTEYVRSRLEAGLSDALGTGVRIEQYSLGWVSGGELGAVEVDNPPGFDPEHPAISLRGARFDVSVLSLLWGRMSVEATVEGLELRVQQKVDGSSNIEALLAGGPEVDVQMPPEREEEPSESGDPGGRQFDGLRLDIEVIDGRVDIEHEEHGLLESLRGVQVQLKKEYGADVRMTVSSRLHRPDSEVAGKIDVDVDVDPSLTRPVQANLALVGIDLARYRPLLSAFVPPGDVEAFAGLLGGSTQVLFDLEANSLRTEGNLNIERPHLSGPLFSGMDIRGEHWVVSPNLLIQLADGDEPPVLKTEELRVDLGFLAVRGMSQSTASDLSGGGAAFGMRFDVDLQALGQLGGPIPALLGEKPGRIEGSIALPVQEGATLADLGEDVLHRLVLDGTVRMDGFDLHDHEVGAVVGEFGLESGKIVAGLRSEVAGGPASLSLRVNALDMETLPCEATLSWSGGQLAAASVPVVRYLVPALAGADAGLDFQSGLSCEVTLRGPAIPQSDDAVGWLGAWNGGGALNFSNAGFTPSAEIAPLFELAGSSGKLSFREISTKFTLADGFLVTDALEFTRKAKGVVLAGRTSLAGAIDYRIDLSGELQRHRDGRKVLDALGGAMPEISLGGTLDAPQLQLPDMVQGLLQGGVEKAVDNVLKKNLNKLFRDRR